MTTGTCEWFKLCYITKVHGRHAGTGTYDKVNRGGQLDKEEEESLRAAKVWVHTHVVMGNIVFKKK